MMITVQHAQHAHDYGATYTSLLATPIPLTAYNIWLGGS
jgi:hypothetical protein